METKSDGELLEASLRGEHEAFGQLVARYQDLVCAVSFSSTGDDVLSEDVAQDTFIAAWRQLAGLREPERLRPWLCGIARNLARKARKARRRDELVEEDESMAEGNPFDEAARGQVERVVRDALDRVPAKYREVLVLYYREHESVREVATALGTSEAAVMQWLSRGRRYLADGVSSLVERSMRGERPRRDLVAAVLAAIAVTTFAPHVDANPRSPRERTKGSTMFKLALAATATVAAGTTIYLLAARHDDPAASSPPRGAPAALHLGAGKLGLAHAPTLGPTAAPRQIASRTVAEADLAYLPTDADAVIGLDFAQLQHSPLWQRFVGTRFADVPEIQALAAQCGFDPLRSLAHVTVGLKHRPGDAPTATAVVHGFDKAKTMACLQARAGAATDPESPHVRVDRDVAIMNAPDGGDHVGLTFLTDSTALIVLGRASGTREEILDVARGHQGTDGGAGFAEALGDINTDASIWAMLSDASSVVGAANGALSPYTPQKLGTVYFSLDVTDAVALDAGVHLGSPVEVARAVATLTAKIDAIDPDRTLRRYFDQLDVLADGSDLIFSVAVAGDQLLPLVAASAMKLASALGPAASVGMTAGNPDGFHAHVEVTTRPSDD